MPLAAHAAGWASVELLDLFWREMLGLDDAGVGLRVRPAYNYTSCLVCVPASAVGGFRDKS